MMEVSTTLTEERYDSILAIVNSERSATVQELAERLNVSESTVRRDLTALDKIGRLIKVHGGATAVELEYSTRDLSMREKQSLNYEEKEQIAAYAAKMIRPDDFVYIDAGSTTQLLVEKITELSATYVTNSISHASVLAAKGCTVFILGGRVKSVTDALVGSRTVAALEDYNFTIGFFGTNGADEKHGYTTPDLVESMVKKTAMEHTHHRYVLCDHSKLGTISSVKFAEFGFATVITGTLSSDKYRKCRNVVEVSGPDLHSNV